MMISLLLVRRLLFILKYISKISLHVQVSLCVSTTLVSSHSYSYSHRTGPGFSYGHGLGHAYGHSYGRYHQPRTYHHASYNPVYSRGTPTAALRIAVVDAESPSSKAALSFVQKALDLDSCGAPAKAYIESIVAGDSPATASAAASAVYRKNYFAGTRAAAGSPCAASEIAFRKAAATGEDPVLAAALAYMNSYKSDSPCFAAARSYVEATVEGSDANIAAAKSFAGQLQTLAVQGKPTIDSECAASAQAFASSSSDLSSPRAAAMQAFITKALETGNGYDPVCNSAAEKFIENYQSGKEELVSTFAAARDFLRGYKNAPLSASKSPCAAATKAYINAIKTSESNPSQKALLAFVDEAVLTNGDGLDPVCAAAAEAYFDGFATGAGEAAASEAAAVAYIDALEANPSFDEKSPCGRAAQAYIAAFE